MSAPAHRMVPKPSAAEGWYCCPDEKSFTSNPEYALMVPVCSVCDEYHPEPEGMCLL